MKRFSAFHLLGIRSHEVRSSKLRAVFASIALMVVGMNTQLTAQTVTPAYGGGYGDWQNVAGWYGSPQGFCDAALASLQSQFGTRVWFTPPRGGSFYMPDSFTVHSYPP